MISELFFYGKLKNLEDVSMYEEDFLLFYLNMSLKDLDEFSKDKIEELLEEFYGKENIKNNGIIKFCDKFFQSKGKNYTVSITKEDLNFYKKTEEFEEDINRLNLINKNELYNMLEKIIVDSDVNFYDKLKKSIVYYCGESSLSLDKKIIMLYKYFNIIKNYYKVYRAIDLKLENIPEIFDTIEITDLNFDEKHQSFLIFNNIFTIKNLKYITIDCLISIFCDNISHFIDEVSKYAVSKEEIFYKWSNEFKNIIKPDWDIVLQKRYDINKNKKVSLADIGKELNLTRERVRQIENKAIQKILECSPDVSKLIYSIYKDINREKKEFILIDEFYKYVKNEELVSYFIIMLIHGNLDIKINEEIGIMYNSKEISYEEIKKEAEEQLQNIIVKEDVELYDVVKRSIVDNNYRLYQDKVFVKNGLNVSYIYLNEIKENFINGYNIGSNDDYEKLINIVKEKYGDIKISSMHSIHAMIDRSEFIQIDRGKYKAKEYAIILPEKLLDDIIDYIIVNKPVITYSSIYEKFNEQLTKIGIDNKFYLKGLIDEKLPKGFNSNRDFINIDSDENYTTYDAMKEVFKSFDGEFSLDDIKLKIPGLRNYTYETYAKAEEKNGLIYIGSKSYIYIEKLGISEETKKELKEYIDNLFIKLESNILTSKKIYASLNIMNKELFNKLNITSKVGDFELFSIIQFLYKESYFYSRPIISKEENFNTTRYMLAKEYVKRLNLFSYNDIKNYLYKMNLGGILSYLNFMDSLSDEYIQINKDSMIKKEELNLTKEQLEKIEALVDLFLKNKELIMDRFDGYFLLPKISRGWNKYLLVGILKTYFKEKYYIQNTTNFYDTTDFIIRRVN